MLKPLFVPVLIRTAHRGDLAEVRLSSPRLALKLSASLALVGRAQTSRVALVRVTPIA